jgi:hypothetical protein
LVTATVDPWFCLDVLAVLEVNQGPHLGIRLKDNMATAATVATVWTTLGQALSAKEVTATSAPVAGLQEDLDVVNKIGICHGYVYYRD